MCYTGWIAWLARIEREHSLHCLQRHCFVFLLPLWTSLFSRGGLSGMGEKFRDQHSIVMNYQKVLAMVQRCSSAVKSLVPRRTEVTRIYVQYQVQVRYGTYITW